MLLTIPILLMVQSSKSKAVHWLAQGHVWLHACVHCLQLAADGCTSEPLVELHLSPMPMRLNAVRTAWNSKAQLARLRCQQQTHNCLSSVGGAAVPAGTACSRQTRNTIPQPPDTHQVPCAGHVSPCTAGAACSWRQMASPVRMWMSAQPRRTSARGSASIRTPASQVGCFVGTDLPSLLPRPQHIDRS